MSKKFQLFLSFATVVAMLLISSRDILLTGVTDKNSSLFSLGLLIYFIVFFLNYLDQKNQETSFVLKLFYSSSISPLVVSFFTLLFLSVQNDFQFSNFPIIAVISLTVGVVVGPLSKVISRSRKNLFKD